MKENPIEDCSALHSCHSKTKTEAINFIFKMILKQFRDIYII